MFNEARKCAACGASFMNGTAHKCPTSDEEGARRKLESWLGEWSLEGVNTDE